MPLTSEQRKRMELLRERKQELKELQSSAGWALLRECIREQRVARNQEIFGTEPTLDGAIRTQRHIGEVAGMQTCLALPESLIQDYERDIADLELDGEDTNDGIDSTTE